METESFVPRPARNGRTLATLAVSAALLVVLHATALAQGCQTGTIRGSVVDAQGRLVLPGVTVTVRSNSVRFAPSPASKGHSGRAKRRAAKQS